MRKFTLFFMAMLCAVGVRAGISWDETTKTLTLESPFLERQIAGLWRIGWWLPEMVGGVWRVCEIDEGGQKVQTFCKS